MNFARKLLSWITMALVLYTQSQIAINWLGGWEAVNDSRPIVSGRHPLHQVHGIIGISSLFNHGSTSCYDPSFQAGYPKTPVFDGGCRPAEFVMAVAYLFDRSNNFDKSSRTYKYGLLGICMLPPIIFAVSAIGAGSTRWGAICAAVGGSLLWWTPTCLGMLNSGEIDLLLGGLCGVGFCGCLAGYHRNPGPRSWIMLAILTIFGWYAHPLICLTFFPFSAAYYCSLAPRHGLAWHLGYFGAGLVGFLANISWLWDWGRFWWLRHPSTDALVLPTATELANASGGTLNLLSQTHVLGWPVIFVGSVCMIAMLRLRARTPAWLFASAMIATLLLSWFGPAVSILEGAMIERVASLSVGLAIVPIGFIIGELAKRFVLAYVIVAAVAVIPFLVLNNVKIPSMDMHINNVPVGLTSDQLKIIQTIREQTSPTARILLEEDINNRLPGWNWTAFLPQLTQRAYVGGLDFGSSIESMNCPIRRRSDPEGKIAVTDVIEVLKRYNIGWIICRSESTSERWRGLPTTKEVARIGEVTIFSFNRPHRYIIQGEGNVIQADQQKIVLTDVVPSIVNPIDTNGSVILSFHYQQGMRISPPNVILEPEKDPYDPTPLIRLRMNGPVSRITISWTP